MKGERDSLRLEQAKLKPLLYSAVSEGNHIRQFLSLRLRNGVCFEDGRSGYFTVPYTHEFMKATPIRIYTKLSGNLSRYEDEGTYMFSTYLARTVVWVAQSSV